MTAAQAGYSGPGEPRVQVSDSEEQSVGKLWAALRLQPLWPQGWHALAQQYALQGLPWHRAYANTQALRCSAAQGLAACGAKAVQFTPAAVVLWGDADAMLSRSGLPWAGWAQVRARLVQAVSDEPGDWLSWLYLARCDELSHAQAGPGSVHGLESTARAAVRAAIALEPLAGESGHLLAQWRLRAGQPAAALAALEAVLLQAPHRHGSWLLQAQALMQLGRHEQAQGAFERAGQSRNPDFLALLADKLYHFNFADESLAVREVLVKLQPRRVAFWLQLAVMQSKLWQLEQAQASVAEALALEPANAQAQQLAEDLLSAGHSRLQFDRALAAYEAQGLRDNGQGAARLLMQSLYQAHLSPEAVADLHRRLGQALQEQANQAFPADLPAPASLPQDDKRRLRVGYVTGDLHRQHPVNVFMLPVLQHHDHGALEVFVYQTGSFIDEYTRMARACADHWREAAYLNDIQLRQMVLDDRIDVLVDLAGYTATQRLGVFASRAAPVQMSYLGYPHSTGLTCIDWMIGDDVVSPPEHAHLFSEQIARVSGSVFCWAPVDHYPLAPDTGVVRTGPVVFGSFNNLLKMDEATVAVWTRILRECPESCLLLKSAVLADPVVQRQTLERFAMLGIGSERLVLRGPSELSLMMQEYLEVDVALDPFPYNGGTTSLQALWMGCPLITLEGQNFVARMGASFLTHLGRKEWIAPDVPAYVALARQLARQVRQAPWSRHAQRQAMHNSPLCRIAQHTRDIEGIYRQAWEAAQVC